MRTMRNAHKAPHAPCGTGGIGRSLVALALSLSLGVLAGCGGPTVTVSDKKQSVDLTELSGTMVYSQVFDMVSMPENYLGAHVRMRGTALSYTDPDTERTFHAVLIADATACCQQGIEYVLASGDYPQDGTEVTVEGTFATVQENGIEYCMLQDASVVE